MAFTLGEVRRDWLKLEPSCQGSAVLSGGTYNDRIFQISTTVLGKPYTQAGDRFTFRVFCPKDATDVSWRLKRG